MFAPFFKEKNGRLMLKLISHILPCLLVYCSLFLLENELGVAIAGMCHCALYNNPSYSRILIGSRL